uniref:PHD finger protein 5A n=1 Tax=Molossus molossus TaxID=27622 RepID=A0A7J8G030_MOLMO|nr:PHD finger protein 5A [Molossus molossus]
MAKHHPDLIFCRKQAGVAIGRLCEKCDGKCVICDSYVRPCTLVRICDECNYGSYQGRCVICGGPGVSDAYYCKECTIQEKDVEWEGEEKNREREKHRHERDTSSDCHPQDQPGLGTNCNRERWLPKDCQFGEL